MHYVDVSKQLLICWVSLFRSLELFDKDDIGAVIYALGLTHYWCLRQQLTPVKVHRVHSNNNRVISPPTLDIAALSYEWVKRNKKAS